MEDASLAASPSPDDGRKPLPGADNRRNELSVVTEVDLASHRYPISRVRWRQLLSPVGG